MRTTALFALLLIGCADRAKPAVEAYDRGDYAGAARASDEGLAQHPDDDGLWAMRVRASLALGDAEAVQKAYAGYRAHRSSDDKDLLRDVALATLGQALASPSAKLKIIAINAIADAKIESFAETVGERLGDEDDRVAATAAIAVIHGYPQAPKVAGDMLHSENAEARRIAVDGIGKKIGKLALADLEAAASDPDPRVRATAIRWLGQLKDANAVEVLTKRAHDREEDVRAAAFTALARVGLGDLGALGKTAAKDPALAVRMAAVTLLAAAHAQGELTALTDDPDPLVAAEAAFAVARADLAAKALDRAAGAPEWTTRAGAANTASRLDHAAALALAHRLAGDADAAVRLAAARALDHAGDRPAAIAIYAAALADPAHALDAAADLAEAGDDRGLAALGAAVRDATRSPDDRALAASAHATARRVTPGLVAALADPSGSVRVAAAAALLRVTH